MSDFENGDRETTGEFGVVIVIIKPFRKKVKLIRMLSVQSIFRGI